MKNMGLPNWLPMVIFSFCGVSMFVTPSLPAPDNFRYKMTVIIATPDGQKTGSAVREVGVGSEPNLFPAAGGVSYNVTRGEAVVVDLGKRGVVFALMRGADDDADYAHRVAIDALSGRQKGDRVVLAKDQFPMFVRYRDLNDPMTLDVLYSDKYYRGPGDDPHKPPKEHLNDRFEEIFGAGVQLKEVSVELTDEPITPVIQKFLSPDNRKSHAPLGRDFIREGH